MSAILALLLATSVTAMPETAVDGIAAYNLGDYKTAERDLAAAYLETHDLQFLYGYAQAAWQVGGTETAKAIQAYRAFVIACDALAISGQGVCGETAFKNAARKAALDTVVDKGGRHADEK